MKDNVHEHLVASSKLDWEEDPVSVEHQTWKYNLKMFFKGIWRPQGL